jgi:sporulation protein YlmC with PRC-barrel domain
MTAEELLKKGKKIYKSPTRPYLLGRIPKEIEFKEGKIYKLFLNPGATIVRLQKMLGPDLKMYFLLLTSEITKREYFNVSNLCDVYPTYFQQNLLVRLDIYVKQKAGSIENFFLNPPKTKKLQKDLLKIVLYSLNFSTVPFSSVSAVSRIQAVARTRGSLTKEVLNSFVLDTDRLKIARQTQGKFLLEAFFEGKLNLQN